MRFLLDTNAWIKILNQQPSPIQDRFALMSPSDIALCSTVKSELYFGAYKSVRSNANLDLLMTLFAQFSSLHFDDEAAEICGNIRAQLATLGTPIGPYDLQIAGIAISNNLILVTHNTKEFSRITGLRIENWELDSGIE
jgi:tRNA(fMet)-specific endonuclease VapC